MTHLSQRAALFAAVLLLSSFGCSLTDSDEDSFQRIDPASLSQDRSLLLGRWQLQWTTTYSAAESRFVRQSPSETGPTRTLVFLETDSVEVYRDGELSEVRSLSSFLEGPSWGVEKDTLVLSYLYLDGAQYVYQRPEGAPKAGYPDLRARSALRNVFALDQ
jgi:hypothetical protein